MWSRVPKLIRFLFVHALIGMSIGVGVTAFIVWRDLFGLAHLFAETPLALFVFGFQMSLTFGAVQMGVAVMSMDWDN